VPDVLSALKVDESIVAYELAAHLAGEVMALRSGEPDDDNSGPDSRLVLALERQIQPQLQHDIEGSQSITELQEMEQALRSRLDIAVAEHTEGSPLLTAIEELRSQQRELMERDDELRRASEALRAEIAIGRAMLATSSGGGSRDARRKLQQAEKQQVETFEQRQIVRRQIADLVLERKRLELEAARSAEQIERRLLAHTDELRHRYEELATARAALIERLTNSVTIDLEALPDLAKGAGQERRENNASAFGASEAAPVVLQEAQIDSGVPLLGPEADVTVAALEAEDLSPAIEGPHLTTESELEVRVLEYKQRRDKLQSRAVALSLTGAASLVLCGVFAAFASDDVRIVGIGYLLMFALFGFATGDTARQRARSAANDTVDAQNELDLLRIDHDHPERRAQKMLQVNQLDLRRYYDQTLRQGRSVFYLGVMCLLLGFAAVGAALLVIGHQDDTTEKIVVAALGAVSAVLANFIGVVYLKMFSDITTSVRAFHDRLVATHDLYFASFLAAKVSNKDNRETVIGQMALELGNGRRALPIVAKD
jgi:hypothetical protein